MVFNSASFLFFFLPAALILYWVLPGRETKNILLLLLSLVFYAFGGLAQLPVLLAAALWSWAFGLLLARQRARRLWLALGVAGNLGLLCFYKYVGFFLGALALPALSSPLPLPLGISFFSFHAVSYLVDTWREPALAEKRPDRLLLYLAFFPRLLAGPIVKWKDGRCELMQRSVSAADTAAGLRRFVLGLLKKLLLAESAGAVVAALTPHSGAAIAWLAAVSYLLQLYFDLSGYSDMAIGLGRLFGFRFPENFDYPFVSRSFTEFWRRWHITLGRWFFDYLYVPLGGSRQGKCRAALNRMIVFAATGLWHGAGWTFLLWGLWNGLFVTLEGLFPALKKTEGLRLPRRILQHAGTLLLMLLGFVMFRAADVREGWRMLGELFSFAAPTAEGLLALRTALSPARILWLLLAALLSVPVFPRLCRALETRLGADSAAWELVRDAAALLGLFLAVLAMAGGAYTPFIYQQF